MNERMYERMWEKWERKNNFKMDERKEVKKTKRNKVKCEKEEK